MNSPELSGPLILLLRKQHNETQKDLAELLDVGKGHISEIERGNRTTSAERIALICEHYQVSSDYLLGLVDDPQARLKPKRK